MNEHDTMTEQATIPTPFGEWMDISFMGHRSYLGFVSEVEIAGCKFLKVDPLDGDGATGRPIYYRPENVYSMTPRTEEEIRAVIAQRREWEQRREAMTQRPRLDSPVFTEEEQDYHDGADEGEEDPASFQGHGHPTAEEAEDARVEDRVHVGVIAMGTDEGEWP